MCSTGSCGVLMAHSRHSRSLTRPRVPTTGPPHRVSTTGGRSREATMTRTASATGFCGVRMESLRRSSSGRGRLRVLSIALNLEGAIVGYYTDSNYSFHAFLRSPDGKFTTGLVQMRCTGNGSEGCYGTGASNINAFGTIAGGFEDNSGNFVHHSFVRNAEDKLKTFDVPGAGTGIYPRHRLSRL